MIENGKRRIILVILVLTAFFLLALLTQLSLPREDFFEITEGIENDIANNQWNMASSKIDELAEIYNNNKFIILLTAVPENIGPFEKNLEQIKTLTKNQDASSLQSAAALKAHSKDIMNVFTEG